LEDAIKSSEGEIHTLQPVTVALDAQGHYEEVVR
jgi:hypothetical protein